MSSLQYIYLSGIFFSSDFFEIEILCMHFGIVSVCACFLWISNPYRWCHRCL